LRFAEDEVRAMGRTAGGVTGMRLDSGDYVTSMEVLEPGGDLLLVTTRGYGKRTALSEYPVKGRASRGVQTIDKNSLPKIGTITASRVVQENDDLTIISANGVILRTRVTNISRSGRATRGVLIIKLGEGDKVASLARIASYEVKPPDSAGE
jgi:DNA gyrase subunit A